MSVWLEKIDVNCCNFVNQRQRSGCFLLGECERFLLLEAGGCCALFSVSRRSLCA